MTIPGTQFQPEVFIFMGFALAYFVNLLGRFMMFIGDMLEAKDKPISLD
jgi:hypothetical protein